MEQDFNALKTDMYQITMMAADLITGNANSRTTFDLFFRRLPKTRNYMVAVGLEDNLRYLSELRFTGEDIAYLRSLPEFEGQKQHEPFFERLREFRFTGDVWAMREGTPVFGNEPMFIVRAPAFEAQLVETYMLGIAGSRTTLASKASRISDIVAPTPTFEFGTRRIDPDLAIVNARCAYIGGFAGTSNLAAGKKYGIPVSGTMAHSYVMRFGIGSETELDAFRSYSMAFPTKTVLLVDTYDIMQGLKNSIIVAKEMRDRGEELYGIRIDSDDLAHYSKVARKMFDDAGFPNVRVGLSNDLDENKAAEMKIRGAKFDFLGIGTMQATSNDAPHTGVVYKLSEQETDAGWMSERIKISEGKTTLPGFKQVFRYSDSAGMYVGDEIGLVGETRPNAAALLSQVMRGGEVSIDLPTLDQIREYATQEREKLPQQLRGLNKEEYEVRISLDLSARQAHLIRESQAQIRAITAKMRV